MSLSDIDNSADDLWLWNELEGNPQEEQQAHTSAVRVVTAHISPYLLQASSREDYINRKALKLPEIEQVCAKLADGTHFASLVNSVMASYDKDYETLWQAKESAKVATNSHTSGVPGESLGLDAIRDHLTKGHDILPQVGANPWDTHSHAHDIGDGDHDHDDGNDDDDSGKPVLPRPSSSQPGFFETPGVDHPIGIDSYYGPYGMGGQRQSSKRGSTQSSTQGKTAADVGYGYEFPGWGRDLHEDERREHLEKEHGVPSSHLYPEEELNSVHDKLHNEGGLGLEHYHSEHMPEHGSGVVASLAANIGNYRISNYGTIAEVPNIEIDTYGGIHTSTNTSTHLASTGDDDDYEDGGYGSEDDRDPKYDHYDEPGEGEGDNFVDYHEPHPSGNYTYSAKNTPGSARQRSPKNDQPSNWKATHVYAPIGWDQVDPKPHPGSKPITDEMVHAHGYMSPKGPGGMRLVHIEDQGGNHQTVDSRSLKPVGEQKQMRYSPASGLQGKMSTLSPTITLSSIDPQRKGLFTRILNKLAGEKGEDKEVKCPVCGRLVEKAELKEHLEKVHHEDEQEAEKKTPGSAKPGNAKPKPSAGRPHAGPKHSSREAALPSRVRPLYASQRSPQRWADLTGNSDVPQDPESDTGASGSVDPSQVDEAGQFQSTDAPQTLQDQNDMQYDSALKVKIAQIASDILYTNKDIPEIEAIRLAKLTIQRYPKIAMGGADYLPVGEETLTECPQCGFDAYNDDIARCHNCGYYDPSRMKMQGTER